MIRAAVMKADPSMKVARKGTPWIALVGDGPAPIRRGPAPMLMRAMGSIGGPSWSFHPTHAEALAHALTETGMDRPTEHREAP